MTLTLAELPDNALSILAAVLQGAPIAPGARADLPADVAGLVAAAEASDDPASVLEDAIGIEGLALLLRTRTEQPEPEKPTADGAALEAARAAVADVVARVKIDPGAPFEPDALQALNAIRELDRSEWERTREALRKAKVSLRELNRAMSPPAAAARPSSACGMDRYEERDGCSCHITFLADGGEKVRTLANCTARITSDETHDDGAEVRRFFRIEGRTADGATLTPVTVPAARFQAMDWMPDAWGHRVIVTAGNSSKEHLRAAIQTHSRDVETRTVYRHTGWRQIDGSWLFLFAGGAIGPDGLREDITVDLGEGRLSSYQLELDASPAAVRASLDLIRVAPDRVSFPLLAATYRAPLCEIAPVPFGMYVEGQSGSLKTSLSAVLQAHFGRAFSLDNLPAAWSSTGNALEAQAHAAKDVLMVVDDFCPTTTHEAARLHAASDRLFRGAGNRQGRGRMNADGRMRAEKFPRGIIAATGEDLPPGHSQRARLHVVSLRRGDVRLDRLTEAQRAAAQGVFAQGMGTYIQWLARSFDDIRADLPSRQIMLRNEVARQAPMPHPRGADMAAALLVGSETFLRFATEAGALTQPEREDLWARAWAAILLAGEAQAEHLAGADVTDRFVALLEACLSSGRAHLEDLIADPGTEPAEGSRWGWRDGRPMGAAIGWVGPGGRLYLNKESTWAAVQELAARQGGALPVGSDTILRRLGERGLLAERDAGKNLTRKRIHGGRPYVIALHARIFENTGVSGDTCDERDNHAVYVSPIEEDEIGPSPMFQGTLPLPCSSPTSSAPTPSASDRTVPAAVPPAVNMVEELL